MNGNLWVVIFALTVLKNFLGNTVKISIEKSNYKYYQRVNDYSLKTKIIRIPYNSKMKKILQGKEGIFDSGIMCAPLKGNGTINRKSACEGAKRHL